MPTKYSIVVNIGHSFTFQHRFVDAAIKRGIFFSLSPFFFSWGRVKRGGELLCSGICRNKAIFASSGASIRQRIKQQPLSVTCRIGRKGVGAGGGGKGGGGKKLRFFVEMA